MRQLISCGVLSGKGGCARYLLEHDYLLSVPVMNAAAVLRPWALALKINLLLREADCPWGATTTLAAAGRAPLDAQPIQWLLDNGCPANRSTVMRLICHADWIDLACKALRNGGTLHRAHAKRVCHLQGHRCIHPVHEWKRHHMLLHILLVWT